jgi:hypothetical protein
MSPAGTNEPTQVDVVESRVDFARLAYPLLPAIVGLELAPARAASLALLGFATVWMLLEVIGQLPFRSALVVTPAGFSFPRYGKVVVIPWADVEPGSFRVAQGIGLVRPRAFVTWSPSAGACRQRLVESLDHVLYGAGFTLPARRYGRSTEAIASLLQDGSLLHGPASGAQQQRERPAP